MARDESALSLEVITVLKTLGSHSHHIITPSMFVPRIILDTVASTTFVYFRSGLK